MKKLPDFSKLCPSFCGSHFISSFNLHQIFIFPGLFSVFTMLSDGIDFSSLTVFQSFTIIFECLLPLGYGISKNCALVFQLLDK